jgi:hypothetical protein
LPERPSHARTLPTPVKRAIDAHKVVVLLFWNPDGTDDQSVKRALDRVPRRGGRVAVFTSTLSNLSRYTRITAAANVTQTPTLVVVNRKNRARTVTGYLDQESVEQYVIDALRGA